MPSTSHVPCLRYVRGQPSFDTGTKVVSALLGRNPDELENSEDCGSAGGHGNQHVRLRGASIDASKRSARLRQQPVASGRASCSIVNCLIPRSFPLPIQEQVDPVGGRRTYFRRPPEADPGLIPLLLRNPHILAARRWSRHHARVEPRPTPSDFTTSNL